MQDATCQGLLKNFNKAILSTAPSDQPIFHGNDFDAWHDYGPVMQELIIA